VSAVRGAPGDRCASHRSDGGKRFLLCAFCGTEWEFRRIYCAFCGESREQSLPVFVAEKFPHIRVEACDTCRHCIRSVDSRKMDTRFLWWMIWRQFPCAVADESATSGFRPTYLVHEVLAVLAAIRDLLPLKFAFASGLAACYRSVEGAMRKSVIIFSILVLAAFRVIGQTAPPEWRQTLLP